MCNRMPAHIPGHCPPGERATQERKVFSTDFAAIEEGGWPEIIGSMPDLPDPDELDDGYELLRGVLAKAVDQAKNGKGKERHAVDGEAFEDQQILEICERLGNPGFALGQVVKKVYESTRLPPERAEAELLGAINYLAAAIIYLEQTSR